MKKIKLSKIPFHNYVWIVLVFMTILCSWIGYLLCSIDNGADIIPISTEVTKREINVKVNQNHFRYSKIEGILKSDSSFVLEEKNESYPNFSRNVVKELVYSKTSNKFIEKTTTIKKDFTLEKERNHKMWESVWGKVIGIVFFGASLLLFTFFLLAAVIWFDEYKK